MKKSVEVSCLISFSSCHDLGLGLASATVPILQVGFFRRVNKSHPFVSTGALGVTIACPAIGAQV